MPTITLTLFFAVILILALAYLLARFNSIWVYRLFDHAVVRERDKLPPEYELPRYFKLNENGRLDISARWPGWDGWYFFLFPDERSRPFKMIRASLMTGLYGLDGADNYENLGLRLSTFDAVEYLSLIPTLETVGSTQTKTQEENHLSQHYLPKETDFLQMKVNELDIGIKGYKVEADETKRFYGTIKGAWPNYSFDFINPEADIEFRLQYKARNIVWWADLPCVFTYFASFGQFTGSVIFNRGTHQTDPRKIPENKEQYDITGKGCFEHGFARKRFNFDKLWFPVRLFQRFVPSFKPLRYHYELLIGDQEHHGGFMHARGFGIDVRNRGGIYWKDKYKEIKGVKILYPKDWKNRHLNPGPEPDRVVSHCGPRPPVEVPRAWKVEARTKDGLLEYTATRDWPPAAIATNMIYYHFSYKGTYSGTPISGRGYGEYLHM